MNRRQAENSSQTRFILKGILKAGIGFATLVTLGVYLIDYGFTLANFREYILASKTIFIFLFDALFFGLWIGFRNWNSYKKEFQPENR